MIGASMLVLMSCDAQGPVEPVLANAQELEDADLVRAMQRRVTAAHRSRAADLGTSCDRETTAGRAGAAAKACGAEALFAPTPEAIYAYARATARVPRPRADPEIQARAEAADQARAERLLHVVEILEPTLDVSAERTCLATRSATGAWPKGCALEDR